MIKRVIMCERTIGIAVCTVRVARVRIVLIMFDEIVWQMKPGLVHTEMDLSSRVDSVDAVGKSLTIINQVQARRKQRQAILAGAQACKQLEVDAGCFGEGRKTKKVGGRE